MFIACYYFYVTQGLSRYLSAPLIQGRISSFQTFSIWYGFWFDLAKECGRYATLPVVHETGGLKDSKHLTKIA